MKRVVIKAEKTGVHAYVAHLSGVAAAGVGATRLEAVENLAIQIAEVLHAKEDDFRDKEALWRHKVELLEKLASPPKKIIPTGQSARERAKQRWKPRP